MRVTMLLATLFLLAGWGATGASISVYQFDTPAEEVRFQALTKVLRCPQCQNNSLADSNSGLGKDLKDIIHEKMLAGQSDAQIVAFLKARYGDFISFRPPFRPTTYLLWFGPFVLLLLGGIWIWRFPGSRREDSADIVLNGLTTQTLSDWKNEEDTDS